MRPACGAAALGLVLFAAGGAAAAPCEVVGNTRTSDDLFRVASAMSPTDPDEPGRGRKLDIGGNVTDIVRIVNHTNCEVAVYNTQRRNEIVEVPAQGVFRGHLWVPWAEAYAQNKLLYVRVGDRGGFELWQHRGRVYFSRPGELDPSRKDFAEAFKRASPVPGLADEGGRRVLHLMSHQGRLVFLIKGAAQ